MTKYNSIKELVKGTHNDTPRQQVQTVTEPKTPFQNMLFANVNTAQREYP